MLTESEAQRYDRQIRVWGAEAQCRIQSAKVLLCGLRGLNVEVVKNIVLAGVNVVIQDSTDFQTSDLSYAFCCGIEHVGSKFAEAAKSSIQLLNKFATVEIETRSLDMLPDDYFQQFTAVLLSQCSDVQALRINQLCRDVSNSSNSNIAFFWSGVFGEEGWFISDFGADFQYKLDPTVGSTATTSNNNTSINTTTMSSSSNTTTTSITASIVTTNAPIIHSITFPQLRTVLNKKLNEVSTSKHFPLSPTYVKSRLIQTFRDRNHGNYPTLQDAPAFTTYAQELFLAHGLDSQFLTSQQLEKCCAVSAAVLIMTTSVLGSFLSQEVIKAISKSGIPGLNVFVYSSEDYVCKAIPIGV